MPALSLPSLVPGCTISRGSSSSGFLRSWNLKLFPPQASPSTLGAHPCLRMTQKERESRTTMPALLTTPRTAPALGSGFPVEFCVSSKSTPRHPPSWPLLSLCAPLVTQSPTRTQSLGNVLPCRPWTRPFPCPFPFPGVRTGGLTPPAPPVWAFGCLSSKLHLPAVVMA